MSIALFLLKLDLPAEQIVALWSLLDRDEQDRATRYRFEQDASRFVARRGQLRLLLGDRLGCAPRQVRFETSAYGKPAVAGGPHFNLASSGPIALLALSERGAIGCDIERRDPRLAEFGIAERLFTAAENRALAAMPIERRVNGFFDCWTRKEAVVKALGDGLSRPLDSFDVSVEPDPDAALLTPLEGLLLHSSNALPGYSMAICAPAGEALPVPRWVSSPPPQRADRFRQSRSPSTLVSQAGLGALSPGRFTMEGAA